MSIDAYRSALNPELLARYAGWDREQLLSEIWRLEEARGELQSEVERLRSILDPIIAEAQTWERR